MSLDVLVRQLQAGRIGGVGLFAAHAGGVTNIPITTVTEVGLSVEEFDLEGWFASSRYTPQVEGYYEFFGAVGWTDAITDTKRVQSIIGVNGALKRQAVAQANGSNDIQPPIVSGPIYLNGSTDYVSLMAEQNSDPTRRTSSGASSWLAGRLVAVA